MLCSAFLVFSAASTSNFAAFCPYFANALALFLSSSDVCLLILEPATSRRDGDGVVCWARRVRERPIDARPDPDVAVVDARADNADGMRSAVATAGPVIVGKEASAGVDTDEDIWASGVELRGAEALCWAAGPGVGRGGGPITPALRLDAAKSVTNVEMSTVLLALWLAVAGVVPVVDTTGVTPGEEAIPEAGVRSYSEAGFKAVAAEGVKAGAMVDVDPDASLGDGNNPGVGAGARAKEETEAESIDVAAATSGLTSSAGTGFGVGTRLGTQDLGTTGAALPGAASTSTELAAAFRSGVIFGSLETDANGAVTAGVAATCADVEAGFSADFWIEAVGVNVAPGVGVGVGTEAGVDA